MPFFVLAGLVFTSCASVLVILSLLGLILATAPRWLARSMTVLCFLLVASSAVIAYAYAMELFIGYYGANQYERAAWRIRFMGIMAWSYWSFIVSTLAPQLFWFRRLQRPLPVLIIAVVALLPRIIEHTVTSTL
jgi:hypothetical protein